MPVARKKLRARAFYMVQNELSELIDDGDGVLIAFARCRAPGEQPVAAQNDSVAARVQSHRLLQHHGQLKARPLPRQPDQPVCELAVKLLDLRGAVCRRSQRDSPVGMEMIDVRE